MSKTSQRAETFFSMGYREAKLSQPSRLKRTHPNYKDYRRGQRKAELELKAQHSAVPIEGYENLDPPISLDEALKNLNAATHTVMRGVIDTLSPEIVVPVEPPPIQQ